MTRGEARLLALASLVLAASGIAIAASRWLLAAPEDPFSTGGAGFEPWARVAHVLAAPAFLFLVGLVWRRHVGARPREARGRPTGLLLAVLIGGLAATGYLFEVSTGEGPRRLLSLVHTGAGLAFTAAWLAHLRLGSAANGAVATTAAGRSAAFLDRVFRRHR